MSETDAKPTTIREQLIKSFVGVGAMRVLSFPASLLCSIILARMLGPARFGQYAFIMALVPLLALPTGNGIARLLTREVTKFAHAEDWGRYRGILRFGYGWVLAYSLGVLIVILLLAGTLDSDALAGKWRYLPGAAVLVPLLGVIAVLNGATKGLGFVTASEAPSQLVRPLAFLLILAAFAAYGQLTTAVAIGGQLVATGVAVVVAAVLLARKQPGVASHHNAMYATRDWSLMLLPMTLIALVATLNAQFGIVLLGLIGTDESVAAFQIADSGAKLVTLSLVLVNMVIGPQIVKYRLADDSAGLQHLSRQSARSALLIAGPLAFAFIIFGKPIITLFYGAEYAAIAYWPLTILALGNLASVFIGSVGYLLIMSGYEKETLRGQVISLVVNIVACSVLIPLYGAVGAALGVMIGVIVWNVLMAARVYSRLGIRPSAI